MTKKADFKGFPKESIKFLKDLKKNNDKSWFNQNRQKYELFFLKPAKDFITAIAPKLEKVFPDINAFPAVNKSIFKLHRDVRFSNDKTPFNPRMALWFWEGSDRRMDCSGFYISIVPNKIMLGAGMYMFTKDALAAYRNAVVHEKHGPELAKMIKQMEKNGFSVEGKHYKRVPRGFDAEHKNADLLLYNGLYAGKETKIPELFYTPEIVDYCVENFTKMAPLHNWLVSITS